MLDFNFEVGILGQVALSFILGGMIGLEREWAQKPAGLRTHMLVSGAATLLVLLGDIMISTFNNSNMINAVRADPIRIIEAIITGISFLGAGTIILRERKESVEGLTTAASILFASAIGICVALQKFYLSVALTVLVLIILTVLGYIERWIQRVKKNWSDNQEQ